MISITTISGVNQTGNPKGTNPLKNPKPWLNSAKKINSKKTR